VRISEKRFRLKRLMKKPTRDHIVPIILMSGDRPIGTGVGTIRQKEIVRRRPGLR
jgi:hypothetical protein